ncbi:ADP-dependent glucokinase [Stomoxys calcitrans]|uniref:ADP-dependent glucokinase n=1 Tax=Stomoxys calcitrans TaxID=35570 RepID=A0A1I8Q8X7_STOCA|nr:ADP-dependent glucokinase [Stomoxys calcitrans]
MTLLKYMSYFTTFSVFAALISIVWQAFLSLKQLNKVTLILTSLLAIENLKRPSPNAPKLKVALGYGACSDLIISATDFLNYSSEIVPEIKPEFTVDEVNDEVELLQTFGYYFENGAAAERVMPNSYLFRKLIQIAKKQHKDNIQWVIGGNAPLMGIRFDKEGWEVLLGARVSHKLRRLIPNSIKIAGDQIEDDDIHLILEYKAGEKWGPFTAPRANRYILHNDQNNPHLNSLEHLQKAIKVYQPDLFVISGIQMMDSYKFEVGIREERLLKLNKQINELAPHTQIHFEMASYVEIELLQQLRTYILPYVDSLGMNEQELENLAQVMEYGKTSFATDCNPRVGATLDQMRKVFSMLAKDYYQNASTVIKTKRRMVTRIHLHTLAFQALLTAKDSAWKNTKIGAAKAALVAHRYVCQTQMINPESASLILDDSFSTSLDADKAQRVSFDPQNAVPCWSETLQITAQKSQEIEICVAPVLVCRVAKKTAGAGDNISAAGLSQQL